MVGLPYLDRPAYLPSPGVSWWVLAVAFAATEVYVVHLDARRQGQTISLSEIPLVVGLFLAAPVALVVGKVVGSLAAMVVHRRSPLVKVTFNLALHVAEASVAVAVFRTLTRPAGRVRAGHLAGRLRGRVRRERPLALRRHRGRRVPRRRPAPADRPRAPP